MKVAALTGGGDCPGLNAVIRAVVRRGEQYGFEFVGVRDGWRGLMENNKQGVLAQVVRGGVIRVGDKIEAA